MPRCWIAIGGNSGSVGATFQQALTQLDQSSDIHVVRVSRNFTTTPVGGSAGSQFLNAAAELQTSLDPIELLDRLQQTENGFGRIRGLRWGPRSLDLDLLFYGDHAEVLFNSPRLVLPHPHLWYRRFVLDPLAEIAPDLVHPSAGYTIKQLLERVESRPLICQLSGGDAATRRELRQLAAQAFPQTHWLQASSELSSTESAPLQDGQSAEPILSFWLGGAPGWTHLPIASRVDVTAFPTSAWETIRDVLTAALDAPYPVIGLGTHSGHR